MIINPFWLKRVTAQVFGVIGDSNADGRGATIPTISSNTLYNFNGSTYDAITTQSVANDDNTKGSIWQNFATQYKASTGNPVYLVNGASGGAEFYPNGDNNNWYTSGTLYDAFKTKMAAALAARSANSPDAIFLNLGINDLRSSNTITDIRTGIDSLFARLSSDYPDVPIICIQIGLEETGVTNGQKAYDIRSYLISKAESISNVYFAAAGGFFIGISGGYLGDNLHYSQDTNDKIGYQLNTWFDNASISNKWARAVISSSFTPMNSVRRTLVSDFITSQYNNGNYMKMEGLYFWVPMDSEDVCSDWTFLGYQIAAVGATFSTNSHIIFTGSNSSNIASSFTPAYYNRAASQNDMIFGVKLRTRTTSSGTNAVLTGRSDGTYQFRIAQSTTAANYHHNNTGANQRSTSDANLVAGTLYSAARNGTTRYLIKDATIFDTNTQASDGLCTQNMVTGVNNSNGTLSFPINATATYGYAAKYTTFDLSSFYAEIEYVITHWND